MNEFVARNGLIAQNNSQFTGSITQGAYTASFGGNVGIGKVSPTTKLDVSGSALITGSLTVTNGVTNGVLLNQDANGGVISIINGGATVGKITGNPGGAVNGIDLYVYDGLQLKTLNTSFTVQPSVAIGWNTYSGYGFTFRGASGFGGEVVMKDIINNNEVFHAYLDGSKITFPDASVTIGKPGTTYPNAKLDVSGSALITGSLTVTKDATINGLTVGLGGGNQYNNTVIGYQAQNAIAYGGNNVIIGYQAGYSCSSGSQNVYIGEQAGFNMTNGDGNVFIGRQSGYLSSGSQYSSTFVGANTGYYNQGVENTF